MTTIWPLALDPMIWGLITNITISAPTVYFSLKYTIYFIYAMLYYSVGRMILSS